MEFDRPVGSSADLTDEERLALRLENLQNKEYFGDTGILCSVLDMMEDEHEAQIEKWDYQIHNLPEWLMYTTEEVGELSHAVSEYLYRNGNLEEVMKEAVQVATLAAKIASMCKEVLSEIERVRRVQEAHRNQRSDG